MSGVNTNAQDYVTRGSTNTQGYSELSDATQMYRVSQPSDTTQIRN